MDCADFGLHLRAGPHGRWPGPPEQGDRSADHPRDAHAAARALPAAGARADSPIATRTCALPGGRALMEPMVLARLVQLARVRAGDRVLVVGAGSGYGAAVLSACGGVVTALEEDPALLAIAAPGAARRGARRDDPGGQAAGRGARALGGDHDRGRRAARSRQRSRCSCGRDNGRLVTVLADGPGLGQGVLAEPIDPAAPNAMLRAQAHFDCATPLLPAFRPQAGLQVLAACVPGLWQASAAMGERLMQAQADFGGHGAAVLASGAAQAQTHHAAGRAGGGLLRRTRRCWPRGRSCAPPMKACRRRCPAGGRPSSCRARPATRDGTYHSTGQFGDHRRAATRATSSPARRR